MKEVYWQQGDVVFIASRIPNNKMERSLNPVIQHGEATGHAHRIAMFKHDSMRSSGAIDDVTTSLNWEILLDKKVGTRYLKVTDEPIEVRHEEHKPVTLPPGEYEIRITREYDHFLEEARAVVD